ncbi:MAG: hypothetical protein WCG63_03385 [Opitutaceae bacterium]|jgi:hypothetical protein
MIVIRRMVDRQRSYTGIFLPGEPAQIFPTTDYEHARILQIYKQDRPHEGIINDFTDLDAITPNPTTPTPSASVKPKKRKAAARQPRRTQI